MKQLSDSDIASIYNRAAAWGRVDADATSVYFYDPSVLADRLDQLACNFPDDALHAVAIKANARPEVLRLIADAGHGLEAASFEEVLMAAEAGVPPEKIVFDSPVKTNREIDACHRGFPGMTVNSNSLEELRRYPEGFSGRLGLRINPMVNAEAPAMWNVSGRASKFGVDIHRRADIIKACVQYGNISGLHIHVGSGIRDFTANVEAVRLVVELAEEIDDARRGHGIEGRIEWIDIGGGILFGEPKGEYGVRAFVERLKQRTNLFENYRVITEYGKFVHNDAGFVVTDVEYVLPGTKDADPHTAFIHVGADLFVRKVYSDLPIEFPLSVIRAEANDSNGSQAYNIAGPLCFAGDFLYQGVKLPVLKEGDRLVIQRAGANTLSMWSRHCGRREPQFLLV